MELFDRGASWDRSCLILGTDRILHSQQARQENLLHQYRPAVEPVKRAPGPEFARRTRLRRTLERGAAQRVLRREGRTFERLADELRVGTAQRLAERRVTELTQPGKPL